MVINLSNRPLDRRVDSLGVAIRDPVGRVLEANDAFLRTHGYTRDDLIAKRIDWSALTPDEWKPKARQALTLLYEYQRGVTIAYDGEHFHKDGHRVPVSIETQPISGTDLLLCTIVDLSEQVPAPAMDPQTAFSAAQERFGLTNRERDVLSHLLEGLANKEIGFALAISPTTVTEHVQAIMRKVGVRKRGQLFKHVYLEAFSGAVYLRTASSMVSGIACSATGAAGFSAMPHPSAPPATYVK